jgi:Retrotransposon gag protein
MSAFHDEMEDDRSAQSTPAPPFHLVTPTPPPSLPEVISRMQRDLEQLARQNNALQTQNRQLEDRLTITEAAAKARPQGMESKAPKVKTPKMRDPEPFSGEKAQLFNFLSQCKLKFLGESDRFPTELSKVLFAASHLRGSAYQWFQPLLNRSETDAVPELVTFKGFSDALTSMYGDRHLVEAMELEIDQLTQTSSVAVYATEFRRLQQYISWDDAALRHRFYRGLRNSVKDALVHEPKPSTLLELMEAANRLDNRIAERYAERSGSKQSSSSAQPRPTPRVSHAPAIRTVQAPAALSVPTPAPALPAPPAAGGPTPMELDNSRPRVVSETERERRRTQNLCFYCGGAGHRGFNCPNRAKPRYPPRPISVASSLQPHQAPTRPASPTDTSLFSVDVDATNAYTHE